jgi:hypothetical protein
MSCFEILDPRFKALIDPVAFLETIHTGNRWAEGPVWFGDLRCLVWSDIPNSRMLRWDEESGHVSLFRKPTPNANGNTRDREGRLITCEQGGRRVVRTEWDGSITVLASASDSTRRTCPRKNQRSKMQMVRNLQNRLSGLSGASRIHHRLAPILGKGFAQSVGAQRAKAGLVQRQTGRLGHGVHEIGSLKVRIRISGIFSLVLQHCLKHQMNTGCRRNWPSALCRQMRR